MFVMLVSTEISVSWSVFFTATGITFSSNLLLVHCEFFKNHVKLKQETLRAVTIAMIYSTLFSQTYILTNRTSMMEILLLK